MADTQDPQNIADLYQQVLGRAPDAGGLAYWQQQFGDTVDPNELATFKSAAAPEISAKSAADQWFTANPNATNQEVANAVQSYGGLTPQLASVLAQHYGTDVGTIESNYNQLTSAPKAPAPDYTDLVNQAYAGIGRTGVGTNVSNIDQGGLDYWKGQLASGALTPENFNTAFSNAVTSYEKANPTDAYTQYVQNYQVGQQAEPLKTNIGNILQDKQISWDEANAIKAYQDQYNFTPEQIAKVTGYDVNQIKQLIGARGNILSNVISTNASNPLALANFATQYGLTAQQMADASGGKFTQDQVQNALDKSKTYAGQLQLGSPDAYSKIASYAQFDADRYYNGQIQDYQVQILTPLDTVKSGIPKQLDITPAKTEKRVGLDENDQPYEYINIVEPAKANNPNIQPIELDDGTIGYQSTVPVNMNGVPVYAQYDANGKVTGYVGNSSTRVFLPGGDSGSISGKWDAAGNVITQYHQPGRSGGFAGFAEDLGSGLRSALGDVGWTAAKLFPATAPYANALDAINAYNRGDIKGAVLNAGASFAGYQGNVASDMTTPGSAIQVTGTDLGGGVVPATEVNAAAAATTNAANTRLALGAVTAYDAAKTGNYAPLLAVGANISGINKMPEVSAALNTMSAATAIANKDYASALNAAGALTNNPDLKLAGAATKFINAYNSGNPTAITTAAFELGMTAQDNAKQSGAAKTVFDAVSNSTKTTLPQGSTITPEGPSTKTSDVTGVDLTDLSKGVQVAGPGGLDQGGFKPGTPTQTATGMFFTTPEGKTYPVTVNKETGMMTTTDPAGVNEVKQFRINDTSGIKDIFFDKTPLNPNLSAGETTALSKVTGKSSGDITDVEAKNASPEVKQQAEDLGNTLLEKIKGGASMGDMLRMIGGLDTAENATALYLAKQIPELRAIMDNAQNSGYVSELGNHLATDPTNVDWLQEYKGLTGKDYTIPDMGEIVITGSRPVNEDGTSEGAGEVKDTFTNPYNGITSTTQVDAKTGVETVTEVDPKTKVTTQTTTTPDSVTKVVTDLSSKIVTKTDIKTNTSTTIKIDTKTGSVTVVPSEKTSTSTTPTGTTPTGTTPTGATPTGATPTTTTPATSTPTTTTASKSMFGTGAATENGKPSFLEPEPFKTHFIKQDFKPLNPTLFALAGIDPLKGTFEERLSEQEKQQPEKKMPTLADLVFAPNTQQAAGLMPTPFAADGGDGTASQPQTPLPENIPDETIPAYAHGGLTQGHPMGEPQFYSQGGLGNLHVQGDGDGTSDSVPAMVAKDEFVLPADVVSSLGNGSSEAGASILDHFVEIIRQHKHSNKPSELPPDSKGPLEYLASAMKKGHM